ncbi:MAG TPA: class I SAM-dependent methyltransferase [Beijerinckiaceae bacterium]|nr:class I SAM-dependent methyltransferase [Beijerinckiaceae bacterium]
MNVSASPRIAISSGIPALDVYLERDYETVKGMSSRFAAAIAGHLIAFQARRGIVGDIAEIGAFKGRFFIAMMLAAEAGDRGLGIDVFSWPSDATYDEFVANCAAHGLKAPRIDAWKADTRTMGVRDLRKRLLGRAVRFFHIDGDHSDICLTKDLELATKVMHPEGILCLDDMLHPGYPTLVATVMRYLKRHPEMGVFCVVDREDIVAAPKFMLCRRTMKDTYEAELMRAFPQFHWVLGADFGAEDWCVVLTPSPRLAAVD